MPRFINKLTFSSHRKNERNKLLQKTIFTSSITLKFTRANRWLIMIYECESSKKNPRWSYSTQRCCPFEVLHGRMSLDVPFSPLPDNQETFANCFPRWHQNKMYFHIQRRFLSCERVRPSFHLALLLAKKPWWWLKGFFYFSRLNVNIFKL